MKNDTLSKLFLSFVFVFSSTAAFTEESTSAADPTHIIRNNIDYFIKDIERIQSTEEGKRSLGDISLAVRALKNLKRYPDDKRVINVLTQSIEYELKRHLHKNITVGIFSYKKYSANIDGNILNAAAKSLFKVVSHNEEKNYLRFENWITAFIKKVEYSHLDMFAEFFLLQNESWNHPKFPKWMKVYIERVEKEGKNHYSRFVEGFDERRRAVSIFQALKDHPFFERLLDQHTEKALRGVEVLKDNGHGFFKPSSLLNKKNKELERVDFYNEVFYNTLQEAIKSGEYDKAYTDYIKEINGEATMQKSIRPLDTAGKGESNLNKLCKNLFL